MDGQSVQRVEQSGDWLVDADTGEIIGLSEESSKWISTITSAHDLERYMANLMEMETDLAARKMALSAIIENANKMIGQLQGRIDWYKLRHQNEVRSVAESNLTRGSKTYRCVYGTVSFRRKSARIVVKDDETAIAWAEKNKPDAVVTTKKILVSKIDIDSLTDDNNAFEVIPAEESMAIKTL